MPEKHSSGKYKIIKLLSNGPFAKVYHARDTRSGKSVAIKVIDNVQQTQNLVEIQAMTRLSHPHVTHLVEVFAAAAVSRAYIVTEFAECGDLFDKIAGRGRLSEDLSRNFFHQLISAISHCHSRRVYHRDIKVENLFLDHNWRLKLSDFGLSHVVIDDDDMTMLRDQCGTHEYAAPEVLAGKGYHGDKADVWSCGVVLYVMTAGFLPFDGDVDVMWRKMKRGEFLLPKWMSPGLKWLLLRILDPNPETRIAIDEIMEDGWFRKGYDEQMSNLDDSATFSS